MEIKVTLCFEDSTIQFLKDELRNIRHKLDALKTQGDQTMAAIDDLNAAIAAEDVEVQDLLTSIAAIAADITKLKAAVAAGATPTDLTNQIAAVQSHLASLTTGATQLKASDTEANA